MQTTRTCVRVSRMSSETTFSTPRKAAKRRESRNQAVVPIFVGYAFFCYSLGESWQDVLHICGEFIPKALHGVAFVSYDERDTIV